MTPFEQATAIEPAGELRWTTTVPAGWEQGRGAFGGLVVALLARAVEAAEPARPVRSLTAEIPAPLLVGPAELRVTVLRRGSGTTTLDALLVQDGTTCAHATAVLGSPRPIDASWEPLAPDLPPLDAASPIRGLPPVFAQHFDYRPTGPIPFAGGAEAVAEGWIALREPGRGDVAELAALCDAYWPTLFAVSQAPRPTATISFGLHVTAAARAPLDGPAFYRARGVVLGEGFLFEQRELWSRHGRLLAVNPQTFVVIQ